MQRERGAAALAVRRFRGPDATTALRLAARALGDDAVVLRTDVYRHAPEAERVEVAAAAADAVERFRARLTPAPLAARGRRPGVSRPLVLALVGPTGAGKTTTLAKLALHADAFRGWTVGLLTLDCFRTGALEQLDAYAQAARLPLEVAYHASEVPGAIRRLARCDVILVDTPGRSPRSAALNAQWTATLRAVAPDEVHLVVPATVRPDLAPVLRAAYRDAGATHLVLSKLDELPGDHGVAELAAALALPTRWVTDGQEVPGDLQPGVGRVLSALGAPAVVMEGVGV